MLYTLDRPSTPCTVCESAANIRSDITVGQQINCSRCGDFDIPRIVVDDMPQLLKDEKSRALASHTIRKMQVGGPRLHLASDFFESLKLRNLPTPVEATDNLIEWLAEQADGRPGRLIEIAHASPSILGIVGVIGPEDVHWLVTSLRTEGFIYCDMDLSTVPDRNYGYLTAKGWQRFEELKRAHVASNYAFFARKFSNPDLDSVYANCLRPAVKATGYDLRTVTQRAGLIDSVIEDEIRRCRFLVADLSDDNSGAYWEAGFAEGLGKPVIYVCHREVKTHFDADHRQTIRWDLNNFDETAAQLKAIIRNTLLGDAKQSDD